MDLSKYQKAIEKYFRIVNKVGDTVDFVLNDIQRRLINELTGRDIILKARQEGVSSLILAIFTCDFLWTENSRSVCISHEAAMTQKLFDRVKFFLKSFEDKSGLKVPLKYNSRTEIVNQVNNAFFYIGTAGAKEFGRGETLTNVHFSEFARYPDPEKIYLSASQAGNPKLIVIETTANGIGDFFYQMWCDAQEKKNNYKPHFFGWQDHKEYRLQVLDSWQMNLEEQDLMSRYGLTKEQLAWRREKMKEFTNEDFFKQEYPLTWQEAFLSSGKPVFNTSALQWYKENKEMVCRPLKVGNLVGFKPPVFEEGIEGYLKIWKMPEPEGQYVIGADPCEGVPQGDFACAQVLDRRKFEQVAVWHGHADPDIFAKELIKLGYFYNTAWIAPERNNQGIATILTMRDLYYPSIWMRERVGELADRLTPELGWVTDMKTKPLMIADLAEAIRDKNIIIHDEQTVNELFSYQYDEAGHANAAKGAYDDRVTSLAIAVQLYKRVPLDKESENVITKEEGQEGITGPQDMVQPGMGPEEYF